MIIFYPPSSSLSWTPTSTILWLWAAGTGHHLPTALSSFPSFSSLDSMSHHYTLNSQLSPPSSTFSCSMVPTNYTLLHTCTHTAKQYNYDNFSQFKLTATNFNQALRDVQKFNDSILVNPHPSLLDIDFTAVQKKKKITDKRYDTGNWIFLCMVWAIIYLWLSSNKENDIVEQSQCFK